MRTITQKSKIVGKDMNANVYEAQKRYSENQKRRGMVRVNTFVPEELAEHLKNIAADMRSGKWSAKDS